MIRDFVQAKNHTRYYEIEVIFSSPSSKLSNRSFHFNIVSLDFFPPRVHDFLIWLLSAMYYKCSKHKTNKRNINC